MKLTSVTFMPVPVKTTFHHLVFHWLSHRQPLLQLLAYHSTCQLIISEQ